MCAAWFLLIFCLLPLSLAVLLWLRSQALYRRTVAAPCLVTDFGKNCYFPIMWPCDSFIPSPFRATIMKRSWMLIKGVYSVYWNDHGVFCPPYSNVFQCMFAVLMNSVCRRFTEEVCVYVDQGNGSVVSCVAVVILSNLDTKHWLHE